VTHFQKVFLLFLFPVLDLHSSLIIILIINIISSILPALKILESDYIPVQNNNSLGCLVQGAAS
jgi:hypothetical protein